MLTAFRETQIPLLAAVLITAGLAKLVLRGPGAPDGAPVVDMLRHHRGLSVVAALGEVILGVTLLVAPGQEVRAATVIWFVAATWVVDELRTRRPDAGCGCFGALSTTRIGLRVMVRPMLLAGAALLTLGVPGTGRERLLGLRGCWLLCEVAVLVLLSPELGVLMARWRATVPCEMRQSPLEQTLSILRANRIWREHASMLRSTEPVEVWRELCWRFLVFTAMSGGREKELVFAVSMAGSRHPEVRVALVDARTPEPPDEPANEDTGPNPRAVIPA